MTYARKTIARLKAVMEAGIGPKLLSRLTDVPFHTLRDWDLGRSNATIGPDQVVVNELKALLRR